MNPFEVPLNGRLSTQTVAAFAVQIAEALAQVNFGPSLSVEAPFGFQLRFGLRNIGVLFEGD